MNGVRELVYALNRGGVCVGDVVTVNGQVCVVADISSQIVWDVSSIVIAVKPLSAWRRLRIWLRERWPFQFRSFWARVWTR